MKIAVFIADERMKLIAEKLKENAEILEIEEDDNVGRLRKYAPFLDAVVLPAWSIESNGFIKMKTRGIFAAEFLETLSSSCVLFAGNPSEFLQSICCRKIYWLKDEKLLQHNADLTAEGLLARLIEMTELSIFDIKIDVIGTGRCGSSCAALFNKLNLNFRMVTTSAKSTAYPYPWIMLNEWQNENPSDVIVNTAPVCVMKQATLRHWKQRKLVFDLSSNAMGVDEKCAKHPFLHLLKEPALPSRYAKESAADLIVQLIRKELKL